MKSSKRQARIAKRFAKKAEKAIKRYNKIHKKRYEVLKEYERQNIAIDMLDRRVNQQRTAPVQFIQSMEQEQVEKARKVYKKIWG